MRRLFRVLFLLLLPLTARAEILWETNFDNLPDWSKLYHDYSITGGTPKQCTVENLTSTTCLQSGLPPAGFYGWYMSPDVKTANGISPRGIHIDGTNKRGATGKGFTAWDRHSGEVNVFSNGGQLSFEIPPRPEIFVRYWIKYQPGYVVGPNWIQKLGHISHYKYNGYPFMFFGNGYNLTVVPTLTKYAAGVADVHLGATVRTDPSYQTKQPSTNTEGVGTYFDLPNDAYPAGNYGGTGTDFTTPGMIGDGAWHAIEYQLKSNSVPGTADGVFKFWFDGHLQYANSAVLYRESTSLIPYEETWNMVHISGNSNFNLSDIDEYWRAYDDIVTYTPLTSSDPLWAASPQDGRLPLNYIIGGGSVPADAAPVVTAFSLPASSSSLSVAVSAFSANDDAGVTGYRITETPEPPAVTAAGWSATPPASFTFGGPGVRTAYAWVKDSAGNVSTPKTAAVNIAVPAQISIQASAGTGGTITPSGVSFVSPGGSLTYSIKPNVGYYTQSVVVDGQTRLSNLGATSYSFSNVTGSHTIVANFGVATYNITASAGLNGSISPAGVTTVNYGSSRTYTITPAAGYAVASVLINGTSIGAPTSYTFSNVTANQTISATFKLAQVSIQASASAGGTISPSGLSYVSPGGSRSYTITPNQGYYTASIVVNGRTVLSNLGVTSYTLSNVTVATTIVANFAVSTFSITASSGLNGSISPAGVSTVSYGSSRTYTITPASRYVVNSVMVDGASVGARTSYTFSNINSNHTISATFKRRSVWNWRR